MNPTAPYTLAGFVSGALYGRYRHYRDFPFGDEFSSITIPYLMTIYSLPGAALGLTTGLLVGMSKKSNLVSKVWRRK